MAGRPRIKSKVVRATLENQDVLGMFHDVLGASGSADLSVVYPKYKRVRSQVERFLQLLEKLRTWDALSPEQQELLSGYVGSLREQMTAAFDAPDLDALAPPPRSVADALALGDYSRVPPDVAAKFNATYAAMKTCSLVNTIIVTCKNLIPYRKYIEDIKALSDRFLVRSAGTSLCPLPDLALNFRQVYIGERLNDDGRRFVLLVLHKLHEISHDTYKAVTSPDVDVDRFVSVIMESIGQVRKHIPRCNEAFDKIVQSVELLRTNFGDYYKDFVSSNSPTTIMENFVLDVSKSSNTSPRVTSQFRSIITHYRKLASQQATDPKLQSLFRHVDAAFVELDGREGAPADGSSSEDDEAADGGAPAGGVPVGGAPAGGVPAGGVPVGGAPAGGVPAGGTPAADAPAGNAKAGGRAASRARRKKAARARANLKRASACAEGIGASPGGSGGVGADGDDDADEADEAAVAVEADESTVDVATDGIDGATGADGAAGADETSEAGVSGGSDGPGASEQ